MKELLDELGQALIELILGIGCIAAVGTAITLISSY